MERSLDLVMRAEVPFEMACAHLAANPADVLGAEVKPGQGMRVDLAVEVASGFSMAQQVELELEVLGAQPDTARYGVCWHAAGHPELFPVFGGDLELRPAGEGTEVRLRGWYRLPLGWLGRFGDAVAGRRVARHAIETLLAGVTRRLETAAISPLVAGTGEPDPAAVARLGASLYWG